MDRRYTAGAVRRLYADKRTTEEHHCAVLMTRGSLILGIASDPEVGHRELKSQIHCLLPGYEPTE